MEPDAGGDGSRGTGLAAGEGFEPGVHIEVIAPGADALAADFEGAGDGEFDDAVADGEAVDALVHDEVAIGDLAEDFPTAGAGLGEEALEDGGDRFGADDGAGGDVVVDGVFGEVGGELGGIGVGVLPFGDEGADDLGRGSHGGLLGLLSG